MIADLGLSKFVADTNSNSTSKICGMPAYVEPQIYKNIENKYIRDKKSDIYSLGVLLWEISSGKPPFSGYGEFAIAMEISSDKRETPIEGTPPDYVQLYQRCWDSNPSSRPDIEEVHSILTRLKSQYTVEPELEKNGIIHFDYEKFSKIEKIGEGGFGT